MALNNLYCLSISFRKAITLRKPTTITSITESATVRAFCTKARAVSTNSANASIISDTICLNRSKALFVAVTAVSTAASILVLIASRMVGKAAKAISTKPFNITPKPFIKPTTALRANSKAAMASFLACSKTHLSAALSLSKIKFTALFKPSISAEAASASQPKKPPLSSSDFFFLSSASCLAAAVFSAASLLASS
jgi:hypothetical protein